MVWFLIIDFMQKNYVVAVIITSLICFAGIIHHCMHCLTLSTCCTKATANSIRYFNY